MYNRADGIDRTDFVVLTEDAAPFSDVRCKEKAALTLLLSLAGCILGSGPHVIGGVGKFLAIRAHAPTISWLSALTYSPFIQRQRLPTAAAIRHEHVRKQPATVTAHVSGVLPVLSAVKNFMVAEPVVPAMGPLRRHMQRRTQGLRMTAYQFGELPEEPLTTSAGVQMPRMIYSTVYKGEEDKKNVDTVSKDLVVSAVRAGFRGVDLVTEASNETTGLNKFGRALAEIFESGVPRESLFIQTRVNPVHARELYPAPYSVQPQPIAEQVNLSISKSFATLGLDYIDSLVLQHPYETLNETMTAWRTMESYVEAGSVRQLGVSNVFSLKRLQEIYEQATVKPALLRMAFHAAAGWEQEARFWCAEVGIYFQSFYTITANKHLFQLKAITEMAEKYQVEPPVLLYRFVMGLHLPIVPLTTTADKDHMVENVQARRVPLTEEDAIAIREVLTKDKPKNSFSVGSSLRKGKNKKR